MVPCHPRRQNDSGRMYVKYVSDTLQIFFSSNLCYACIYDITARVDKPKRVDTNNAYA